MDMTLDSLHAGSIKRIRQACANCRRKKTKCTGERPICLHCRRNRLACIYEPYATTIGDSNHMPPVVPTGNNPNANSTELLQRISSIESRLAELSGRGPAQSSNNLQNFASPANQIRPPPGDNEVPLFTSLSPPTSDHSPFPPTHVLRSVVDTYFEHVHNQPYSHVQEASFRQKLQTNALPRCLILAVLSSAVRFSSNDYFIGKTQDASEKFARESWLSVLTEHLTVEDNISVHVVQTVNLLAVVDYTAGRVSSGWLKVGLAARISQDLHLMVEPDEWLPNVEQEERRRAFWSAYLIDKLISCGRSRPLVILDEDCNVQLPCDEQTFRNGGWKKTNTIGQLLNWNSEVTESPSPFALVMLMASILGRCTRYVHQNRRADEIPPWDPKSEFSAINSSLLLLESYSKVGNRPMSEILQNESQANNTFDIQEVGHLIFAHTIFHLCHCLLNHPFLVRLRLKVFGSKAPASFSARSLRIGCDHARKLVDVLRNASENGHHVESSFYAYCIAVAGGVNSLASHFEHQQAECSQSDISYYFNECLGALNRLGKLWVHAGNMAVRLQEFHNMSHQFASLLDPTCLMEDLDPVSQEVLCNLLHAMDGKQLSPWNGVVSGTTAAILANTLVYPLDIVKTRLQVQIQKRELKAKGRDTIEHAEYHNAVDTTLHILREDGIYGLYSGLNSSICGTASMNFAYFYWSAVARGVLQSVPRLRDLSEANKIVKELGLGAVGGAMAQLCTNPIAVISTRQQTRKAGEKGISMWTTMMEIVQSEDGWTGLWRGLKVNLILVVNPMITYGVYQSLRGRLVSLKKELSSLDAFLLGALSKVLATIATHPLIVAKTMLQSKPPECRNGKPFKGFTEALAYVISNEGFFRLYKGLAPQIIKGFLVQGLMMMLKERTEVLLIMAISLHRRRVQRLS
ncbi:hypothetical protein N7519_006121 [Penicillium mononematosum]|uniref:uncharacterized protein n=1 Tax=Penicillium mononematosum TaxID=268346 RepID=UPI0025481390|nr:uncharacterized protein N7519_006121 [Penicillium mononematosum]KAJ6184820.1 hypothetical protein N7519_006121 [Penicillium mononematosum]